MIKKQQCEVKKSKLHCNCQVAHPQNYLHYLKNPDSNGEFFHFSSWKQFNVFTCLWESLKYAGTVTTAFFTDVPK